MATRIIRYWPRAWLGDGGITTSVKRISRETVHAGADVRVVVSDDGEPQQNGSFTWVTAAHRGKGSLLYPVRFEELLEDADLLVLHSAWTRFNLRAAAVARELGVPYLLEPRGAYDPSILRRKRAVKRAWWLAGERRLVHGAAAVHTFFDSEREHLEALGYDGPIVTVPNGVTVPDNIKWDGGSGGYVLWIGRFDPEHKGLDLLLHGMSLLPKASRPALRLHGPDWAGGKEATIRLVAELGLEPWVMIGDPVYGDEKWSLIEKATAFVYPSRWEAFGNSTAEAVSLGVPTLTTPYPLGRWLESRDAAVVAEASPEGLADGLLRVTERSRELRDKPVSGGLHEELTWRSVARSWLDQVEQII